jgi:hypothetical protein
MATVYVTEYAQVDGSGGMLPKAPPVAYQAVAIGSAGAPFSANTRIIRVAVDAVCSIYIGPKNAAGSTPAATTAQPRFATGVPGEYFAVNPGDSFSSVTNT